MAEVVELWRYPVKSMAGERLDACTITGNGLEGDRRWALIDGTPNRAGKFLTIRQHEHLLRYRPRLKDGEVEVEVPDGSVMTAGPGLVERLELETSRPLALSDDAGANFDDSHVLIINLASIELFALEAGMNLDRRRFRANLYVDGLEPEEEVGWVGRRIRAGDAELDVVKRDERCVVITRDPDTTVATPELLRLLTERHDQCMGVYCSVVRPGRVAVGDFVGPLS
jgi:uncharacterized protein YcbX